jgi:prefoldin subunit 5
MNQEQLEKEVAEYNEIVKEIQNLNQRITTLDQERLLKLGRVQMIQETISKAKSQEQEVTPSVEVKETKKSKK